VIYSPRSGGSSRCADHRAFSRRPFGECINPRTFLTNGSIAGYSDTMKHWRLPMVAEAEARMTKRWLVTCSCGWERECSSEWAARSASRLHPQLAPMDVAHVTRVEGPEGGASGQHLTLT
jgi:hypothetical protein